MGSCGLSVEVNCAGVIRLPASVAVSGAPVWTRLLFLRTVALSSVIARPWAWFHEVVEAAAPGEYSSIGFWPRQSKPAPPAVGRLGAGRQRRRTGRWNAVAGGRRLVLWGRAWNSSSTYRYGQPLRDNPRMRHHVIIFTRTVSLDAKRAGQNPGTESKGANPLTATFPGSASNGGDTRSSPITWLIFRRRFRQLQLVIAILARADQPSAAGEPPGPRSQQWADLRR